MPRQNRRRVVTELVVLIRTPWVRCRQPARAHKRRSSPKLDEHFSNGNEH